MRRRLILTLIPALALVAACSDDANNEFMTSSSGSDTATGTGSPSDLPAETGTASADTGDGDGDGDSGDGDGDGDGDSGDGDGDSADTGVGMCGNGIIEVGEQCDTDDLNGFTCMDLGYDSGELACDPVTCTYDASACVTDMDGGSSGGTTG